MMSRGVTGTLVRGIFTLRSTHQKRRENSHCLGRDEARGGLLGYRITEGDIGDRD